MINFDMFSLYLSFPARNSKFHLQSTRIIVVYCGRNLSIRKCSFSPNLNKDEKRSILNTLTKSLGDALSFCHSGKDSLRT